MKCPKCGYELAEGHLYCDSCGEEIRIVPDFEPEIEQEMNETLSTLFVELAKEKMPEIPTDENVTAESAVEESPGESPQKSRQSRRLIVSLGIIIVVMIACTVGYSIYRNRSVPYQLAKAKECASQGKYTQAIGYLEKIHDLEADNAEVMFLMADYYYIQEKYDFAVYTLQQIIEFEEQYKEVDLESAYDKIISIYKTQKNYQAINSLLLSCSDENIVNTFQKYIAKPPQFSYVEGNYEEVIPLKLSANTSGKIYYTLDGSEPDENSDVYTAPIFLETGSYTVKAYFINDYGIKSDVVSHTYRIDLVEPAAPEVSVYSGDYYEPYLIEVSAAENCSIYYTTDSTDPTTDSILYTAPIPMPLGKSVYKFIAVSPEGVASDITIRSYKLTLNTEISTDMAIMNVVHALMREDVLLDEQGSLRGMSGHNIYKYSAVTRIEGEDYYVFYEYYEDATGIQTRTDRIYGVNIQDGSVCRITYDNDGKIILIPLE
ncbi:MAG: hypothetical protein GX235_05915 [Clostridiales bacterium]|nr:hypothetical protein [Clostridiales bacterium]